MVWPPAGSDLPKPRIRTLDPDTTLRVLFGSCRYATPKAVTGDKHFDADALDTYAKRMARLPDDRWPDALILLGDQVYADETSDGGPGADQGPAGHRGRAVRAGARLRGVHLAVRRGLERPGRPLAALDDPVVDDLRRPRRPGRLEHLRRRGAARCSRPRGGRSGSSAACRRTGSTSTSATSRRKDLADNELYQRVRAHDGDCEQMLREFAAAADKEADGHKGTQWSYRRDLGDVRLLVIDSRCGRVLETGDRSMVSDAGVPLDRGAGRGPVRPPARRHVAAVAAAAGAARRGVLERGARRRPARSVDGPLGRVVPPGRRPRALGGVPAVLRPAGRAVPQRRARRPRRPRRPAARLDLRALRRRAPRLRGPGAVRGRRPVAGLPAHLLAGAQLRARRS